MHRLQLATFLPLMRQSLLPLVALALLASCATPSATERRNTGQKKPSATTSAPSVAGTTWSGKDSDGDFFEYTFLKDGHLKYRTNTQRSHIVTFQDATDTWTQNGNTVTLKVNRFSTDVGTIHGNTMTGKGGNIEGRHWTWTFTRKSP